MVGITETAPPSALGWGDALDLVTPGAGADYPLSLARLGAG